MSCSDDQTTGNDALGNLDDAVAAAAFRRLVRLLQHRSDAANIDLKAFSFESYRAYYGYLSQGKVSLQYSYRVNNTGEFALPATRIEALYAPEMFGMAPNAKLTVQAAGK